MTVYDQAGRGDYQSRYAGSFVGNPDVNHGRMQLESTPSENEESWPPPKDLFHSHVDCNSSATTTAASDGYPNTPVNFQSPVPSVNNARRPWSSSNMHDITEDSFPLSQVLPGPVWPSDTQLSTAYGYAVRNVDGSYTRLIRADDLARFRDRDLPHSQGPEGLIIVPPTRVSSPNSRNGLKSYIPRATTNQLPSNQTKRPYKNDPQVQVDNVIARTATKPFRREKIYCDKWIHEGVCAFTQMGCKYKHVMPTDKATQVSLGLSQGFPTWYRRQHLEVSDDTPVSLPGESSDTLSRARLDDNWRRNVGSSGVSQHKNPSGTHSKVRNAYLGTQSGVSLGQSYGPIAPPCHQTPRNHTLPSFLQTEHAGEDGDGEEDQVTWTGRNRQC